MRRDTTELAVSELESMSVDQESITLERNAAHLSSQLDDDAPWTIHGIAIGEGDVTRGQSGIRKKWPREALKPATDTLEGRSLVEDHDNSSRGVVGEVVATEYRDGVGILYEAELYDEELAERVANGLLEVSIRGYHGDVEEMDETEEGAKLVERVRFDNLSIVPSGAAPSNSAEMGPSSELSPAECAEMMADELGYDVPEGAEEEGNPNKLEEEPERYPEEDDTPREDREGMHEFDEGEEAADDGTDDEEVDTAELAEYEMHQPDWDGSHENEWSTPDFEDFREPYNVDDDTSFSELDEEMRNAIAEHFLIVQGGFPPESYGDLKLPVVEPDGELSRNALMAVKGGRGASAVDGLSSEMEEDIMQWVNQTASKVFDEDWAEEEEAAKHHHETAMEMANEFVAMDDNSADMPISDFHDWTDDDDVSKAINEYLDQSEDNSEDDPINAMMGWLGSMMDTDDEEASDDPADEADEPADAGDEVGEDDDTVTVLSADRSIPVVSDDGTGNEPVRIVAADDNNTGDSTMTDEITEEELEELRRKANAYDELEEGDDDGTDPSEAVDELREEFQSDLEELKDRTAILDEVDRSDVEALQETDEPYVMEREKYEQLEEDVESVRSLYAEALSKRTGVPAERIQDKWTLEEMREDLEDELDDDEELEGELTPDPQGADPDEEELEEAAEAEAADDDSVSEEAAEKQEEIKQRILD